MSDSDFEYDNVDDDDDDDDDDIEDDIVKIKIDDDEEADEDGDGDGDEDEDGGGVDFQYTDTTFNTIANKIDRRKKRTFETTKTEISIFVKEIMDFAPDLIKVKDIDIIINILSNISVQLNHYVFVIAYISSGRKLNKKNMDVIQDRVLKNISRKMTIYDVIRYVRFIEKLKIK